MNGIPGDLFGRVQAVLLRCGPFDSDRTLRPLFVDARLSAWRDLLPEADSHVKRVRAVINELSQRANGHLSGGRIAVWMFGYDGQRLGVDAEYKKRLSLSRE